MRLFFTAAALLCTAAVSAAMPSESDAIAASVNGEPISVRDLIEETGRDEQIIYQTRPPAEHYQAILKLRKAALEKQINRKLLIDEYGKQTFKIPQQYIENAMDEIALQQGIRSRREFYAKLREQKTTPEELRKYILNQLIIQAMTARRVQLKGQITPQEIRAYFENHLQEFGKAERWDIGLIQLKSDSPVYQLPGGVNALAEQVKKSPERFEALCALYSTGPNAEKGGSLGAIPYAALRPEFAAACKGQKTGTAIGPVKTDDGIYILKLRKIYPAEPPDFAQVEPELRKKMETERRNAIMEEYYRELRSKAMIRIYEE